MDFSVFIKWTLVVLLSTQTACNHQATEEDWPQFKKDNFRSGVSNVVLDVATLSQKWVHNGGLPIPAWYGPAKEDAYARSGPLPSMRDYDLSYYPIIVGNRLFFSSTSDHAVHCLDAADGTTDWVFHTGAPVRIAPTYHDGILYFGSDDGYVYAVKARNGSLVWKYSPTANQRQKVINNDNFISFWPIRTGVLVDDGIAYFGASLLPWKSSYFCAIDIKTGQPTGQNRYVKTYQGLTMEGVMAATKDKIIQPQGRTAPIFFSKATGKNQGQIAGTGGCFVLVTPDQNIVHGQNSRKKSLSETYTAKALRSIKDRKDADYMSFKGGKEMIVKDSISYILTDNSLSAYHRKTKKILWLRRNYNAHRIIAAGNVLIVGANDKVMAVSPQNGLPLWEAPVKGTVYALSVAGNSLYASTGEGYIYCFKAGDTANPLYALNKDKPAAVEKVVKKAPVEKNENPLTLAVGPFITPLSKNKATLYFETKAPTAVRLKFIDGTLEDIKENQATTKHRLVIEGLRKGFSYRYQIDQGDKRTNTFEFDNFFNFEVPNSKLEQTADAFVEKAAKYLKAKRNFALVFAVKNLHKAIDLSTKKGVSAFIFEADAEAVQEARALLQKRGIYGHGVVVQHIKDFKNIDFNLKDWADLVYVNDDFVPVDKVIDFLKPNGTALLEKSKRMDVKKWAATGANTWQASYDDGDDAYGVLVKQPYDDIGTWTHQYGMADNTAFGGESLWGSSDTEDFEVQWLGRPGPRFQTDRSGRKPSPLAVAGKMFVQGSNRIAAVDAYHGGVLWSKSMPGVNRMNVVRDCSNWATDERHLYVVIHDRLLKVAHRDGALNAAMSLPDGLTEHKDWGYIALTKDNVIGSVIPKGGSFSNFHGGEGWYDSTSGTATDKVVSSHLFAKDKKTQAVIWTYGHPKHHIINSTITLKNGVLSFLMSKNIRLKLTKEHRANPKVFKKLYLVSLNVANGKMLFEKPIRIEPGITACYMTSNNGYNVVVSSAKGNYHAYGYSADDGRLLWKQKQAWPYNHHGGHLAKPAIVGNRLVIKPGVYDLRTGQMVDNAVPKAGHGCASYALTEQSIFYRGYTVTQYNFDTKKFAQWSRLRPDCWISTIPAQGMVLSPEAGGGCSCGEWLETSIVFAPKYRAPILLKKASVAGGDDFSVSIVPRDENHQGIYYTLDGSVPTKDSTPYTAPIKLTKTTNIKAVIYLKKKGKILPFVRNKLFVVGDEQAAVTQK